MKKGLTKTRSGTVAALDIGSTKICCFIAHASDAVAAPLIGINHEDTARPRVVGVGHQISKGVKSGVIVDMDAAEDSILTAVQAAENMAGEQIDRVFVNLAGGHPASQTYDIEVPLEGQEISDRDLRHVLDQWHRIKPTPERTLIHSIPLGFSLDQTSGIRDPRGMVGQTLGTNMHVVTAQVGAVRNLAAVIRRCHLEIEGFVVAPLASGLAALVEDEKDLGVTVIDMGGGTTSIAVFFDGHPIYTDCIPIGGSHITADVAHGLSTSLADAERLKTLYGGATVSPLDDQEMIDVPLIGEDQHGIANHIPKSHLIQIIKPRLEETFELVRERLEQSGFERLAGRRVVLTGGGSQLPGLRDLAQLVLQKQIRMCRPLRIQGLAEAAGGPAFATCAGLLTYAVNPQIDAPRVVRSMSPSAPALLSRVSRWLREYF